MANALEQHRRGPKAEAPKPRHAPPSTSEVEKLLDGIDQDKSNAMVAAWDAASRETQATMGEAMWALAMIQARVLASAEMGAQQVWAASRFSELVAIALPPMMMAVERAKHADPGKPPNDA